MLQNGRWMEDEKTTSTTVPRHQTVIEAWDINVHTIEIHSTQKSNAVWLVTAFIQDMQREFIQHYGYLSILSINIDPFMAVSIWSDHLDYVLCVCMFFFCFLSFSSDISNSFSQWNDCKLSSTCTECTTDPCCPYHKLYDTSYSHLATYDVRPWVSPRWEPLWDSNA